jgi:hypothetical protein
MIISISNGFATKRGEEPVFPKYTAYQTFLEISNLQN